MTMKTADQYFIYVLVALLLITGISHAQTIISRSAPNVVNIDGDAGEWGDKLINIDNKASYCLANDKANLYLMVKTKDKVLQGNLLGAGITFTVDMGGGKSTTFPVNDQKDARVYLHLDTLQTQIKTELTKYKKIAVAGFTTINDEQLSTVNPYGIKIVIGYGSDGYLVYEEAIPLVLLNEKDLYSNRWGFTLKINGLKNEIKAYLFYITNAFYGNAIPSEAELGQQESKHDKSARGILKAGPEAVARNLAAAIRAGLKPLIKIENFTPSTEVSGKFMLVKN
jgi:hypothetical protein